MILFLGYPSLNDKLYYYISSFIVKYCTFYNTSTWHLGFKLQKDPKLVFVTVHNKMFLVTIISKNLGTLNSASCQIAVSPI